MSPGERAAVRTLVDRVRNEVQADLVQAALFGSRARGDHRPDSDVDLLLVFRRLPHDREPFATQAEHIAAEVASETGVPVTVWSVSLIDFVRGRRTPMLVDAAADAIPVWYVDRPLSAVPFTPQDALRCSAALLDRIEEGSAEFAASLRTRDPGAAARRGRDDIVRACTALLLLAGRTRPRRADTVREAARLLFPRDRPAPPAVGEILEWVVRSFGRDGRDDGERIPPPPCSPEGLGAVVDFLRCRVERTGVALARSLGLPGGNGNGSRGRA